MDKMSAHTDPVAEYLASLDEPTRQDSEILLDMMQRISGEAPKVWNAGTIGFGTYHFRYSSGREGDALVIGFYPRKGKITIYLMDGTARHAGALARLGNHTTTGYCIYIKRLSDVDATVLRQVVQASYDFIKAESASGPIDRILWKTEK
jgi:hypothetical protein